MQSAIIVFALFRVVNNDLGITGSILFAYFVNVFLFQFHLVFSFFEGRWQMSWLSGRGPDVLRNAVEMFWRICPATAKHTLHEWSNRKYTSIAKSEKSRRMATGGVHPFLARMSCALFSLFRQCQRPWKIGLKKVSRFTHGGGSLKLFGQCPDEHTTFQKGASLM